MSYKLTSLFCFVSMFGFGQDVNVKSVSESKTNFLGNTISDHKEEFNPHGDLIIRYVYDVNKKIDTYRTFEYNSDAKLFKETGFSKDDVEQEVWTFTYDENGEIVRQKRFYPISNRTHTEYFHLEYNELSQLIKKIDFDKDSMATWTHDYLYNRKNEMIKELSSHRDAVKTETNHKFKNSQIVETILYDFDNDKKEPQENTETYYDYNKLGKLIKKTVHSLAEIGAVPIITEEDYMYNKYGLVDAISRSNNGKFYTKTVFSYEFFY